MRRVQYLFFCLFIFFSLIVNGQNNEASLDSLWQEIEIEDIIVTAQYAPTAIENSVHQVKVIKNIDIEKEGQTNLAEVLSNQLNLRVSNDPILGNGLTIQGIGGENIQIMIDGVPVIGRVGGNIDLSQINVQNIQQIEIIEGAMSAQYGSNASGGVINIITKKSQLNPVRFSFQSQYEDVGILTTSATLGFQHKGLYLSATGYRNDYDFGSIDSLRSTTTRLDFNGNPYQAKVIPWNPKTQYGLDGTLRYRFSDSTSLTYQYRRFDESLHLYGEKKRPQFRPYAFDDNFTTKRNDHSLIFESYIAKQFYLKSTTAYNQYDRIKEALRLDIEPDTTSLVPNQEDTTTFNTFLHRSILSTVSDKILNGQIGVEFLSEYGTGKRIVDTTSLPLNSSRLTNFAFWGSLKMNQKAWTIQTNLRYGYNSKYNHPLVPSVHVDWQPSKKWNLQWSYAHGFRAPTLKELYFNFIDINHYIIGNTDLQAENSKNTALTLNYNHKFNNKNALSTSVKLFYNHINDRIIIAEFETLKFNYQNLDKFETHGLNLRFNYDFKKSLSLQSGWSYTRLFSSWSNDYDSDKFIGQFEIQNRLSVTIPLIKTNLVVTHRFIGKQNRFYLEEDELKIGSINNYHIVNATLSKSLFNNRLFLAIGSKNLTNTESVTFTGAGGGTHSQSGNATLLGWGRTFFGRVKLDF